MVSQAVRNLVQSRRYLAPLAFLIGAIGMLFVGVRLVITNWRLLLIEILPAMWIWAAMLDLKLHALHGKEFHVVRGPLLIALMLVVILLTGVSFFLNAVFAFSISEPGPPQIRPAFTKARVNLRVVLSWGLSVGLALAVATLWMPRWGRWWFTVSLSIVVAVMMLTYIAVPSRLVGMKSTYSTRDQLSATVVSSVVGAVVCSPAYMLGRFGILLLGVRGWFVVGVVVMVIGFALQAGATGAIRAVTISAKLIAGHDLDASTDET